MKTSKSVVSIAAGECHTLIATGERVYSAGANGWGQLGLGHNDTISGVHKIPQLPTGMIQQVAAGR